MTGTEQLREQLEALQSSLRAFEAPIVNDHPGLRLMAETLREREQHIRRQIDKNETCSISLVLRGAATDGAAPADVLAAALTAVAAAVTAVAVTEAGGWEAPPPPATVAEAVTLHVRDLQIDDDVFVMLTRPPGPLAAQLAHPESAAPLSEHAMAKVTDLLAATAAGNAPDLSDEVAGALRALGELVVAAATVLEWQLEPFALEPQGVTLDQTAAQELLRHVAR